MDIGILGTGVVARTLGGRLDRLGHDVLLGTRDPAQTLARTEPDRFGAPPFARWQEAHREVGLGTFAQAAAHGELVVNATAGAASLDALRSAGPETLAGKVLLDVANPLDPSSGFPPALAVSNTDSLAEQIQRLVPGARLVKSLNTVNASVMVDPAALADAEHSIFVSGDDAGAKAMVTDLLRSFGWRDVVDLGDLSTARGPEMLMPLWLRLFGALGTPAFNVKVVR
jgi:8-hydroxy-5-deazaflavin:NADPH oxidoreductase